MVDEQTRVHTHTSETRQRGLRKRAEQPLLEFDAGATSELTVDLRLLESEDLPRRRTLTNDASLIVAPTWKKLTKRTVDLCLGGLAALALAPVLLLVALAVSASSPGPVLFKQRRVGKDGHEFDLLKFRSMRVDAEQELADLQDLNEVQGPVFKIRKDPRLTAVGRFIRRASLDELPQLWNVIKGEMSLVGPRPPLPSEVYEYTSWEAQRLLVTPGITGIWQVSGRSELDFETWVSMDIEYIETWSLSLDLRLLLLTVPAVLSGRGAY